MNKSQFIQAQRRQAQAVADVINVFRGTLGDPEDLVLVPGKAGYYYAQIGGALITARGANVQPIPGLPVLIDRDPLALNQYTIRGADLSAIDGWGGDNYIQVNISPTTNPAWVDQNTLMIGLPLQTDPASDCVILPEFYYPRYGVDTQFPEVNPTTSLLGTLPAATFSKWITVSVNAITGAYAFTVGSDFANDSAVPTAYYSTIAAPWFVLADVRIESDTTAITQNMIYGARRMFLGNSIATSATSGFNRLISSAVVLGAEQSVVISRYIKIEAGGSLTLAPGAQVQILL